LSTGTKSFPGARSSPVRKASRDSPGKSRRAGAPPRGTDALGVVRLHRGRSSTPSRAGWLDRWLVTTWRMPSDGTPSPPPTVASRCPPSCPFHPRRENLLASGPTTSVLRILGSRPTSRRTFRRPAAKAKRRRVTGNDSIHAAPQTALDPELSLGCRRTPPSFESTGVPFLGLTSGGFGPAFSRSAARGESRGSSPSGPEFSNPRRQKVRVPIHINTY
jgi:hypothetical protein